jgi:hypothetical protein
MRLNRSSTRLPKKSCWSSFPTVLFLLHIIVIIMCRSGIYCELCLQTFTTKDQLSEHKKLYCECPLHERKCKQCGVIVKNAVDMNDHFCESNTQQDFKLHAIPCCVTVCGYILSSIEDFERHFQTVHSRLPPPHEHNHGLPTPKQTPVFHKRKVDVSSKATGEGMQKIIVKDSNHI